MRHKINSSSLFFFTVPVLYLNFHNWHLYYVLQNVSEFNNTGQMLFSNDMICQIKTRIRIFSRATNLSNRQKTDCKYKVMHIMLKQIDLMQC